MEDDIVTSGLDTGTGVGLKPILRPEVLCVNDTLKIPTCDKVKIPTFAVQRFQLV
jgi:hypothetical protein